MSTLRIEFVTLGLGELTFIGDASAITEIISTAVMALSSIATPDANLVTVPLGATHAIVTAFGADAYLAWDNKFRGRAVPNPLAEPRLYIGINESKLLSLPTGRKLSCVLAGEAVVTQPVDALAPTAGTFTIGDANGSLIALVTGLSSGETVTKVAPNDGRVGIVGGSALVVGSTASVAGFIDYTLTTSAGRTLVIRVTAKAAVVTQPNSITKPVGAKTASGVVVAQLPAGIAFSGSTAPTTYFTIGADGKLTTTAALASANLPAGNLDIPVTGVAGISTLRIAIEANCFDVDTDAAYEAAYAATSVLTTDWTIALAEGLWLPGKTFTRRYSGTLNNPNAGIGAAAMILDPTKLNRAAQVTVSGGSLTIKSRGDRTSGFGGDGLNAASVQATTSGQVSVNGAGPIVFDRVDFRQKPVFDSYNAKQLGGTPLIWHPKVNATTGAVEGVASVEQNGAGYLASTGERRIYVSYKSDAGGGAGFEGYFDANDDGTITAASTFVIEAGGSGYSAATTFTNYPLASQVQRAKNQYDERAARTTQLRINRLPGGLLSKVATRGCGFGTGSQGLPDTRIVACVYVENAEQAYFHDSVVDNYFTAFGIGYAVDGEVARTFAKNGANDFYDGYPSANIMGSQASIAPKVRLYDNVVCLPLITSGSWSNSHADFHQDLAPSDVLKARDTVVVYNYFFMPASPLLFASQGELNSLNGADQLQFIANNFYTASTPNGAQLANARSFATASFRRNTIIRCVEAYLNDNTAANGIPSSVEPWALMKGAYSAATLYVQGSVVTYNGTYYESTPVTAPVTISVASPGVVTWANHGLPAGSTVTFTTDGTLPVGLALQTSYLIGTVIDVNSFTLTNLAGVAVNTTAASTGTVWGNLTTVKGVAPTDTRFWREFRFEMDIGDNILGAIWEHTSLGGYIRVADPTTSDGVITAKNGDAAYTALPWKVRAQGNAYVSNYTATGSGKSYPEVFAGGSFVFDNYNAQQGYFGYASKFRTDTAVNLKADIDAYFAPKSGSIAAGKGHLAPAVASTPVGTGSGTTPAPTVSAPGAPSLTASSGVRQATLNWAAGANNGAAITEYRLYRSQVDGFTPAAGNLIATITDATSYTDSGLTGGQSYFYRLVAVNSAGPGAASAQVTGSPVATSVPQGFTPTTLMVMGDSLTQKGMSFISSGGSFTQTRVYSGGATHAIEQGISYKTLSPITGGYAVGASTTRSGSGRISTASNATTGNPAGAATNNTADAKYNEQSTGEFSPVTDPSNVVFYLYGTNDGASAAYFTSPKVSMQEIAGQLDLLTGQGKLVFLGNLIPRGRSYVQSEIKAVSNLACQTTNLASVIGVGLRNRDTGAVYTKVTTLTATGQYTISATGAIAFYTGDTIATAQITYLYGTTTSGTYLNTLHNWLSSAAANFVDPDTGTDYQLPGALYNRSLVVSVNTWDALKDPATSGATTMALDGTLTDSLHLTTRGASLLADKAFRPAYDTVFPNAVRQDKPVTKNACLLSLGVNGQLRYPSTGTFQLPTVGMVPVAPGSLRVVTTTGIVAVDNGSGGFVVGNGVTDGAINYSTGQVWVSFSASPGAGSRIFVCADGGSNVLENGLFDPAQGAGAALPSGATGSVPKGWTVTVDANTQNALTAGTLTLNFDSSQTNPDTGLPELRATLAGYTAGTVGTAATITVSNIIPSPAARIAAGDKLRATLQHRILPGADGLVANILGPQVKAQAQSSVAVTRPGQAGAAQNTGVTISAASAGGGASSTPFATQDLTNGVFKGPLCTPPVDTAGMTFSNVQVGILLFIENGKYVSGTVGFSQAGLQKY